MRGHPGLGDLLCYIFYDRCVQAIYYSVLHETEARSPLLVNGERAFVSWNTLLWRYCLTVELGIFHENFVSSTMLVMENTQIRWEIHGPPYFVQGSQTPLNIHIFACRDI